MSLRKMMRNARKHSGYGIGAPPPEALERFEERRTAGISIPFPENERIGPNDYEFRDGGIFIKVTDGIKT